MNSIVTTTLSTDAACGDRPFGMPVFDEFSGIDVCVGAGGGRRDTLATPDGYGASAGAAVRLRAERFVAPNVDGAVANPASVDPSLVDFPSFHPYLGSVPTWSTSR